MGGINTTLIRILRRDVKEKEKRLKGWQKREVNCSTFRLCLGIHKIIEWNDHKRIEYNWMYLSEENEWKRKKLNEIK